jgi:hypothetical protein
MSQTSVKPFSGNASTMPKSNYDTIFPIQQWGFQNPAYTCTVYKDNTEKAIQILKHLIEQKVIKIETVSRFIELTEAVAKLV